MIERKDNKVDEKELFKNLTKTEKTSQLYWKMDIQIQILVKN
jgi:hypothetical protein